MTRSVGRNTGGVYHDDFRLSVTKALGDQLGDALTKLERAALTEENLGRLHDRPGVYQLYLLGERVYVGKADESLPDRLRQHLRKISGRRNIDLSDMTFSCLYVDEDFHALAPERLLIDRFKGAGGIPWNGTGFGPKDPGRERDTTTIKESHFDNKYPIDLDTPIHGISPGRMTLRDFLKEIKRLLPYNFRYEKLPMSNQSSLEVPTHAFSADEAFRMVSEKLGSDWQITALPGYVIMYAEPKDYKSAWRYYRAGNVIEKVPEVDPGGVVEDDPELSYE